MHFTLFKGVGKTFFEEIGDANIDLVLNILHHVRYFYPGNARLSVKKKKKK